jgi:parvulin-like peptidyl-prolyl isomerase
MIDDQLIIAEARRLSITADRSDVDAAIAEIKTQNGLDDAGLDKALADAGFTRERYIADVERQLLVLRTKNAALHPRIHISDAAVDAEAARQMYSTPLTVEARESFRRELKQKAMEREAVVWLAELRKKTPIVRSTGKEGK